MNRTPLFCTDEHNGCPQAPMTEADQAGFDIGWDHAHHGLVPPAELLLDGTPVAQGWRAGRAVFGRRTLPTQRATRLWLSLRTKAWRQGIAYERQQLSAQYLAQIHTAHCPVMRHALGGARHEADSPVVERLNAQGGYAAGNVATLSLAASRAWQELGVMDLVRRANQTGTAREALDQPDAAVWWRLAALRSFATPLPFHEAARMPLAVLPPNRVRLLNSAQGLQTLLTLQFTHPGWSARTRAIGEMLPAHTLRHDYNLFIGAVAPRVLEAAAAGKPLRQALEDAWLSERVQRRWQHFVLCLGEIGTERLLERAAAQGLAGLTTLQHQPEQAVEGWALAEGGRSSHAPLSRMATLVRPPQCGPHEHRALANVTHPAGPHGGPARPQPA